MFLRQKHVVNSLMKLAPGLNVIKLFSCPIHISTEFGISIHFNLQVDEAIMFPRKADKCPTLFMTRRGSEVIKLSSCLTQLSMEFQLVFNPKYCIHVSEFDFVFTNRADPDEMLQYAVFIRVFTFCKNTPFNDFQSQKGLVSQKMFYT